MREYEKMWRKDVDERVQKVIHPSTKDEALEELRYLVFLGEMSAETLVTVEAAFK